MDGRPFRVERQTDSGAAQEQAHDRPSVDRSESSVAPEGVSRTRARAAQPVARSRKPIWYIAAFIVLCIIVAVGFNVWQRITGVSSLIDSSKYQAISFTDGQLYFGKLSVADKDHMVLRDVYYLQPQESETPASNENVQSSSNQNNFKLVKFTDVLYGPEDTLIIPNNQILFYENIKSNGRVAQLIKQSKTE